MMKLSLWYPVKPMHVNQTFGNDPTYYARFHDALGQPEKGHMGVDFMATHGQPVYASADGEAYYSKDDHGGEGIILTTGPCEYENGTCWFNLIYWHLIGDTDPKYPPPIPYGGAVTKVKVGDLIGYADNTGAPFESSGDHLHFGLVPVDSKGKTLLPANGFNGGIDALPYFNKFYASDSGTVIGMYQKILSLLTKIVQTYVI